MTLSLNTRLGCDAKVRKLLASVGEGAVVVKSALFMYIPSPVVNGPPVKAKVVPLATSALHVCACETDVGVIQLDGAPGFAAGSLLKIRLFSDTVTFPVEPESKVFMTLAEAFETMSKPLDRTATGAKANRKSRKVIVTSLAMY